MSLLILVGRPLLLVGLSVSCGESLAMDGSPDGACIRDEPGLGVGVGTGISFAVDWELFPAFIHQDCRFPDFVCKPRD